jgi:hypothetical protein
MAKSDADARLSLQLVVPLPIKDAEGGDECPDNILSLGREQKHTK